MTREERLAEIVLDALSKPKRDRPRFVDDSCGTDQALRAEIGSLLHFHEIARDVLPDPELDPTPSEPDWTRYSLTGYRILSVLGRGATAVVLEAMQERTKRRVAIKVLRDEWQASKASARLRIEGEALARFRHPAIATIYESGTTLVDGRERPFLAMELVDGSDLITHVEEQGLDLQERLALFLEICDAVDHAHQKGVLHRDLKPSNILVTKEGSPKVLDFGLAKASRPSSRFDATRTTVGMVMGTPAYMSPEQAAGENDTLTSSTDVYSLGVLLFELLSGSLPYQVRSLGDIESAHQQGLVSIHELAKAVPTELGAIVHQALRRDPAKRYAAAGDLARDIDNFRQRRTVQAKAAHRRYRASFLWKKHSRLVLGLGSLGLALALGAWVLAGGLDPEARLIRNLRDADRYLKILDDHAQFADNADWAVREKNVLAMRSWLERTEPCLERLDELRASLRTVRTESPSFLDADLQTDLEQTLEAMQAVDRFREPQGPQKRIEGVCRRVSTIRNETLGTYSRQWQEAIDDIAEGDPYKGLRLSPQVGLVPLRKDPNSGLWEFWFWETGASPDITIEGSYDIRPLSGIVLVLLPAGQFFMGAQEDPLKPNHDPRARNKELEVSRVVRLEPFFISKYEVTQAQWTRVMGENPSEWDGLDGNKIDGSHPVEMVSWLDCHRFCRRLDVAMPTEAQWEYACRAGTNTVYSTGNDVESLVGHASRKDPSQGLLAHRPVGQLAPNAFSLHDMHGNVAEWCDDFFYNDPRMKRRPSDGRFVPPSDLVGQKKRCYRGGGFDDQDGFYDRAACRGAADDTTKGENLGLRIARRIDSFL